MKPTIADIEWATNIMNELFAHGFHTALRYEERIYSYSRGENRDYRLGFDDWEYAEGDYFRSNYGLHFYRGETKGCIVDFDRPEWVIKVPFDRSTNPRCRKNDDGTSINYCALEAEKYARACAEGIEECFAATYEVGEINGVKFYLQEFANVDEDSTTDSFYEYASKQVEKYFCRDKEDEDSEDRFRSEIWDFIYEMDDGERVMAVFNNHKNVRKICNFIYDEGINDLHSANWGFTNDGREVIIDYSGYKG